MTTAPTAALSSESVDARFSVLTEALDRHLPAPWKAIATAPRIPFNVILHCVARSAGITVEQMLSPRRDARICRVRHIAMYLVREMTDYSLPQIAKGFRKLDHSTPLYAARAVRDRMDVDPKEAERIAKLRKSIEDVYADLRATADDPNGGERAAQARNLLLSAA